MTLSRKLFTYRFLLINLFVIVYFKWGQPVIFSHLQNMRAAPAVWLASILIIVQVMAYTGAWLKHPFLQERLNKQPPPPTDKDGNLAWSPLIRFLIVVMAMLGHLGFITPMFSLTALRALGITLDGHSFWLGLIAFLYTIGMVTFSGVTILAAFPNMGKLKIPDWMRIHIHMPMLTETLADIMLTLFAVLSMTILWEQTVRKEPFNPASFYDFLGAAGLFIIIFSGANPLAVAEEWLIDRPRWARLTFVILFIAMMTVSIVAIPQM